MSKNQISVGNLKDLISEVINEAGPMSQAQVAGPLKDFITHINSAKSSLGQVYQHLDNPKGQEQAQALLNALNKIVKALDHMPELTKDPWHGARKRD